jgi:hypothetical protein
LLRQLIDVRSLEKGVSSTTEHIGPMVVGQDEENVDGLLCILGSPARPNKKTNKGSGTGDRFQ